MSQNKKFLPLDVLVRKMEYYCTYQERCRKEVKNKISEYETTPRVREKILLHLTKHDFLDEKRFSRSFVRGKFRIKKWGKRRIVNELNYRNIANHHIQEALKEIQEDDYQATIERIISQKSDRSKVKNPLKKRQRVYNYLCSKGFEPDLIQRMMEKLSG